MKLNDNTLVVIGPPGTGKTGHLINMATEAINSGINPQYVGFISFTRQAVQEAKARICKQTGQDPYQFVGFRTLHAMIYWVLGLNRDSIITAEEVLETGTLLENGFRGRSEAQERARLYYHMFTYSRVTSTPLTATWDRLHTEYVGTEEDFLQWVITYKNYKKKANRMDFTDLVDKFVHQQLQFPFTVLFIDEAQDFTPDQWAGVQLLARAAGRVIVAGDVDQSIFAWAGAKGNILEEIEGERFVLNQSRRVPRKPYLLACRVLDIMKRPVYYRPREEEGAVHWIFEDETATLPYTNGQTWFLLCRNRLYMQRIKTMLFNQTIWYEELSLSKKDGATDKLLRRIRWYQGALEGKELRPRQRRDLEKAVFDLDDCISNKLPWHEAFVCWPVHQRLYYKATEPYWDKPKVFVGTFHSAKGAEADNVVLFGNCTRRVREALDRNRIDEWRVLYVALTRTRQNLFLVDGWQRNTIPWWKVIGHDVKFIQEVL